MSKKTKNVQSEKSSGKDFLVMSARVADYKFIDPRSNKPIAYMSDGKNGQRGEMVLQEIDSLKIAVNTKKKTEVNYFAPNNVGVLLSISQKSLHASKEILIGMNEADKLDNADKRKEIIDNSIVIYEYIEKIQSCIVFGYTALEAFSNLSIPDNYEHKICNNKGVTEIYNKDSIERWLSLSKKIGLLLIDIYDTKPIKGTNIWSKFVQFEELRNSIIHQKSINSTDFYKRYFHRNIHVLCETPYEIIKFFFEERSDKTTTNPLWPWLINEKNEFPVSYDFKSENFEVVGNIWEGRKESK